MDMLDIVEAHSLDYILFNPVSKVDFEHSYFAKALVFLKKPKSSFDEMEGCEMARKGGLTKDLQVALATDV